MAEVEQAQAVADHHMRVDVVSSKPKRVLIVVANPVDVDDDGVASWVLGRGADPPVLRADRAWRPGHDRQPSRWKGRDGENEDLQSAIRQFYESEKPTAIYCHGTAASSSIRGARSRRW
jgi:putative intracellular protease/amidase